MENKYGSCVYKPICELLIKINILYENAAIAQLNNMDVELSRNVTAGCVSNG